MLNDAQGQLLIRLARQTIAAQLGIPDQTIAEDQLDQPALREQRGVFVTLHKRGDLRGCIGSLVAAESIVDGIRRNAINAAFHDFRFNPVSVEELPQLHIEVSVLTEPVALPYDRADELLQLLRPGRDGVILEGPGQARATFCPRSGSNCPVWNSFSPSSAVRRG